MKEKNASKKEIAIAVATVAGCGIAIYLLKSAYDMRKVTKRLNIALDVLKSESFQNIDIREGVIENAVREAAVDEVRRSARGTSQRIITDALRKAAEKEEPFLKGIVRDEATKLIANVIDTERVEHDLVNALKRDMSDKLDDSISELTETFKKNLNTASLVYNSMGRAMLESGENT